VLVLLAVCATSALAQEPVTSFAELRTVVREGNIVFVVDEKGERTKGKIAELSEKSLQIMTGGIIGRTVSFTPERVARVSKVDSRLNGFLIGAAIGAVPGLLLGHGFRRWCENESGSTCGTAYPYTGGLFALAGGGIGYAIDGAIDGQTLVFRRPTLAVSIRF
jgi:hypothetical protein